MKRLIIVRVNTNGVEDKEQLLEQVRQRTLKQLKDGVIVVDHTSLVAYTDYDNKTVEVKVVSKEDKIVAVDK